jgi:alkane 1-monooxygenase
MERFKIGYFLSLLNPIMLLIGLFSGYPLTSFFVISAIFLIVYPIIDEFSGRNPVYPYDVICTQDNEPIISAFSGKLLLAYLIVLMNFIILFKGSYNVSSEGLIWLPYAILVGYSCAIGSLTISHELYHTKKTIQTFIARLASIPMFWTYEEIHHLYLHHRDDVSCLPGDGVLSYKGQSLYSYIIQMLTVGFKKSWAIQKELLKNENRHMLSIHNLMLISLLCSLLLSFLILGLFGIWALLFFLIQAAVAIFSYGLATYTQHYGLERRKKADGTYETFNYMNVWNCTSRFGNGMFFNLFHHAHHHAFIFCPYPKLRAIQTAPLVPVSIFVMVYTALVPPLWYAMMDKKVDEVLKKRDEMETAGII